MMQESKIHLSPGERELMQNASVILTKNRVLEKVKYLLESVQQQQVEYAASTGRHQEPFITGPKISKGEYYLGLPYLILDYPRHAAGGNLFFIRSMFWWGNFFSSTLHLSGEYRDVLKDKIITSRDLLSTHYVGISEDPWLHHFSESNYRKVGELQQQEFNRIIESAKHLKIAARWPLSQWDEAPGILFEHWKFLLGCVY